MVLVVFAAMVPHRAKLPARERLPALVRTLALEKKLILPVVPRVNDWPLVVPRVPAPVRYAALLPFAAEIDAVGTPLLTLVKANLALTVDVPPRRRSSVGILSVIAPLVSSNGDPPLTTGRIPLTSIPLFKLTRLEVRVPFAELWTMPAIGVRDERIVVPLMVIEVAGEIVMLPVAPP